MRISAVSEFETQSVATDCDDSDQGVAWSEYATSYDEYVVPLPCYQENINLLRGFLATHELEESPRICDIGAGTGIYIEAMAASLISATFLHVDSNEEMTNYARERYSKLDLSVEISTSLIQEAEFAARSFDLITSINVLYSLPNPSERLQQIYEWIKPGGYFFVIDFGRKQRPIDWTFYFFRQMVIRDGIRKTFQSVPSAINLFKRQAEAASAQKTGDYWLHTTDSFSDALSQSGFVIEKTQMCYRGYADLAICRRPTD